MTRLLLIATVIGAAAQQVAAAEDLHAEMHYSDHYDNNLKPLHHYFYQWPELEAYSTYSPTESSVPSAMPTPSPQQAEESASTSSDEEPAPPTPNDDSTRTASSQARSGADGDWNVLTHELGVFQEGESQDAVQHYSSTLGRQSVIQLQKSATLTSYNIAVDSYQDSSQLKVAFSFYANNMNVSEGFCLEYGLNDETDWNPVRCWQSSIDFENSKWNDDFNAEFALDDMIQVDSIRIRFESIADDGDVMFDHISLLQMR